MKLPKKYTVQECLASLDGLIIRAKKNSKDAENVYKKASKVKIVKLWFGFSYTNKPGFFDYYSELLRYDKSITALNHIKGIHSALSKYPLDALVQLTVQETNDLFGETK